MCNHLVVKGDLDTERVDALFDLFKHERRDLSDIFVGQLVEDYDLVDTVEEFRPERCLERIGNGLLHSLIILGGFVCAESERIVCSRDSGSADVGGHDDDGILEVDLSALGIGKMPVLKYLKKDIEHVGMRLLDLIEKHYRIRMTAYLLGKLSAFLVSDVSGR